MQGCWAVTLHHLGSLFWEKCVTPKCQEIYSFPPIIDIFPFVDNVNWAINHILFFALSTTKWYLKLATLFIKIASHPIDLHKSGPAFTQFLDFTWILIFYFIVGIFKSILIFLMEQYKINNLKYRGWKKE